MAIFSLSNFGLYKNPVKILESSKILDYTEIGAKIRRFFAIKVNRLLVRRWGLAAVPSMVAMTGCGWLAGWMTGQPQCHSSQLTPCVGWEQRDSMVTHCHSATPRRLLPRRLCCCCSSGCSLTRRARCRAPLRLRRGRRRRRERSVTTAHRLGGWDCVDLTGVRLVCLGLWDFGCSEPTTRGWC